MRPLVRRLPPRCAFRFLRQFDKQLFVLLHDARPGELLRPLSPSKAHVDAHHEPLGAARDIGSDYDTLMAHQFTAAVQWVKNKRGDFVIVRTFYMEHCQRL